MSIVFLFQSATPSSKWPAVAIDGFVDAMHTYLDTNPCENLSNYFSFNHPIFQHNPLWGKSFDLLIVRSLQNKDEKSVDWEKALQLAQLVEPACPEWAKIAQSICFFQLKKESEGNAIVEQMICSDAQNENSPAHLMELMRRHWEFTSKNDTGLTSLITTLLQTYDQKSPCTLPKSNSIPYYYFRA